MATIESARTTGRLLTKRTVMAADQNPAPWTMIAPREAVVESYGTAYFSMAPCQLDEAHDAPIDDLTALFAPPVTVCAAPVR